MAALALVSRPSLPSLPTYNTPILEPTFKTTLIRVSNTAGVRHAYARYQQWNFDGSLIYLNFVYPGRMINGITGADIGAFAGSSNGVVCNTTNHIYGVDGGGDRVLYRQVINADGSAGGFTAKHIFGVGYTVWIGGDSSSWEGGISDNDQFICLTLTDVGAGGGDLLAVYDTVADTFVTRAKPALMDNAQISRLGNYVVVVANGETRVWPRALTGTGTQLWASANHGDNGLNAAGEEIFVGNNVGGTGIKSYRLSDGTVTTLQASGSAFEYGHVGAHGPAGWVYLSNYDETAAAGRVGWGQVARLKTDGSGDAEVFAFAYHSSVSGDYDSQPHATPSRDGLRVLFASDWGTGAAGAVYAYIATMESGTGASSFGWATAGAGQNVANAGDAASAWGWSSAGVAVESLIGQAASAWGWSTAGVGEGLFAGGAASAFGWASAGVGANDPPNRTGIAYSSWGFASLSAGVVVMPVLVVGGDPLETGPGRSGLRHPFNRRHPFPRANR